MDYGTAKGGKRGRKRQPDDDNLTEEEKNKKQKNRDAAKKCREKKDREAKELKQRNDELENENRNLSKEKNELKQKVRFYAKHIKVHLKKGCELPASVKEIWDQEEMNFLDNSEDDGETAMAVDSLQQAGSRMHTPPDTPESSSNGKLSPDTHVSQISGTPTELFSGNPLQFEECKRRRCSSNISSSPSSSPGPSPSPQSTQMQIFTQLIKSNNIPPALAPIKTRRNRESEQHTGIDQNSQRSFYQNSVQRVPSVVEELESLSGDDSQNYSSANSERRIILSPIEVKNNEFPRQSVTENEILQKAMAQPDVAIGDEVTREMYSLPNRIQTERNSNLPSMGFSISSSQEYSFTQDLQNVETSEAIIREVGMETHDLQSSYARSQDQYSNDQSQASVFSGMRQEGASNYIRSSAGSDTVQPSIEACSSALLKLGPMTPQMLKQVKESYGSGPLSTKRDQSSEGVSDASQVQLQKTVLSQRKSPAQLVKNKPENTQQALPQMLRENKNLLQTGSQPNIPFNVYAPTAAKSEQAVLTTNKNNFTPQTLAPLQYQQMQNSNNQVAESVSKQMYEAQQLQPSYLSTKNYTTTQDVQYEGNDRLVQTKQNQQFVRGQASSDNSTGVKAYEQPSTSTQLPQTATFSPEDAQMVQSLVTNIHTTGVAESGVPRNFQFQDLSLNAQGLSGFQ